MKCPKCQTELPETANFCLKCGGRLNVCKQPPGPSSIPEAERKRVTALFSDLSEYTSMTEKLDPEEVKEIMSNIFDGIREVVRKYEGFIELFAGDGVLILFGIPKAHEDDPIRAIRAALEINKFVETLSPRYEIKVGRSLSMHSGINTGLVVTADIDPEKGTHGVTGETINVASRLSDLAVARDILVGLDTYRTSQSQFTFQPLKPAKVKGKSEHIQIYKVLSEKSATARVSQDMQVSSEMVGRDQELAKLELHILKAVNGQGSVVNVFGEPGVGKSRLLAELGQREVISRVSFLEGRSISIGKNLSFHPVIDLFKKWAKIREDDTQAEASNKLETAIHRVCGDETDEVIPFVATMMGMNLSGKHSQRVENIEGESMEKLILKNVRDLLIRSSELIPIVIVMEDLHWADTTSLELLESLFHLAQNYRVVFINVFRPGYWQGDDRKVETLPKWLPEADFAEISIKPLGKKMGEALVNNMVQVKGLRHLLKKQIVDRAGGNPFFMEEIVRSLIDEGAIVRTNGTFEVTEKINSIVIPSTINDVLTARIDRLEEQTRDLIKIASVIGRSFFDRILKEVADSIEEVDGRLAYLKEAQFIRDRMRMEELEYLFKHALAQETAYESTLIQQRKELHLKVAQSIEKIFRERVHEFYGTLAHHYSMGEDEEKTEEYLLKAGEEALKSSASSEALYYFKDAIKLYTERHGDAADTSMTAMHEKNIALALYNRGQYDESLDHFRRALTFFNIKMPTNAILTTFKFLSAFSHLIITLYLPMMRFKETPTQSDTEAVSLLNKTCKSLSMINPKHFFIMELNAVKIVSRFDITRFDLGLQVFMGASGLFSFSGVSFKMSNKILKIARNKVARADTRNYTLFELVEMIHNYLEGNWDSIKPYDEDLVTENLCLGRIWDASQHLYWHGFLSIYQGSFKIAKQIINRLNEIFIEYGNDISIAFKYELSTRLLMESRKLHEALIEIDRGIDFKPKMGLSYFLLEMYSCQASIHIIINNPLKADQSLTCANNISSEIDNAVPFQLLNICKSQFMYDLCQLKKSIKSGNETDILKHRKNASKSRKELLKISRKASQHRTESYRLTGIYYWIIRKQKKSLKWWHKAILEGERLGARLELSRAYFEIGKRLVEPESKYKMLNGITPEEYLEKAKVLFDEMDLQWDLNELSRVVRS